MFESFNLLTFPNVYQYVGKSADKLSNVLTGTWKCFGQAVLNGLD